MNSIKKICIILFALNLPYSATGKEQKSNLTNTFTAASAVLASGAVGIGFLTLRYLYGKEHPYFSVKSIKDVVQVEYDSPLPSKKNMISTVIFLKPKAANIHAASEYLEGLKRMISDTPKVYGNDWFIRVYYDDSIASNNGFLELKENCKHLEHVQFARFELKDFKSRIGHKGLVGTIARYLPLFDPSFKGIKVIKNCRGFLTYFDKYKLDSWLQKENTDWFFYNYPYNFFFPGNGGQYASFFNYKFLVRHHSASFASKASLTEKDFLKFYSYMGISQVDRDIYTGYGIDEYALSRYLYASGITKKATYEIIEYIGPWYSANQRSLASRGVDSKSELFNDAWERLYSDPKNPNHFKGLYTTNYTFGMNAYE